jgi:hypothetical protein
MNKPEIVFEIKKARKLTLDLVESFLGTHPQWNFIRSKLLQIFGKHGLEVLLKEVDQMDKENQNVTTDRRN